VQPTLDGTALGIAVVALLLSLVIFGLEPALQLTRLRSLKDELAASAGGAANPKTKRQRTLLRWQVAVAAGFFIIATMFVRYTIQEAQHDSGVDLERLGVAVVNFHVQQWDEARARGAVERLIDELRKDATVDAVSVSSGMPFGLSTIRLGLSTPHRIGVNKDDYDRASGIAATPAFFTTIGVPILRGRGFDHRDHSAARPVVVVSEWTARRMFGISDPIGRDVMIRAQSSGPRTATVIGVARDTDVGQILRDPRPLIYLPLAQQYEPLLTIAARSRTDPLLAVRAVREALARTDPDLAVDVIGTGRAVLAGPWVFLRALGITTVALGGVTLLLAMVGLFGIQCHIVAHRTREIGVRVAFGATRSGIQRMVIADGYRPVVEGLLLGLFIGVVGRAAVLVYLDIDVSVLDPWMLLVTPIPLILAAYCACYLPARRAASVDPNVALRHV
jgi:putative ABC transport system permease protein